MRVSLRQAARPSGPAFPCAVCGRDVRRTPRGGPEGHARAVRSRRIRAAGDPRRGRRAARPLAILCPDCRYRIYDYPRVCVGFAVVKAGHLLILTRAHEPRRGWLDLPGGFIEEGESLEAAARRELLEETGLSVGRAEPLGLHWDRYFLRGFGRFPTISFYFVARWRSGEPRAGDDAARAAWVPFARLSRPGLRLAWPHMREVFAEARRWDRSRARR